MELSIEKKNETYILLKGEPSILQELDDMFTFFADGYRYHPKYRAKLWDGRIRMIRRKTQTVAELYHGLLFDVIKFCKNRDYKYSLHDNLKLQNVPSAESLNDYIKNLRVSYKGEEIFPRDYQQKGFIDSIQNKRHVLRSSTGSGKSLIIYLIVRYLIQEGKRGMIIVPNTSLVHQLYNDFISYSEINQWDTQTNSHKIFSGQEKETDKPITFSTWQSLSALIKYNKYQADKILASYDFVIIDEAHGAKGIEITKIVEKCINASYRIGLTGTLNNCKANINQIIGLTGSINKLNTTKELIEKKELSDLLINCLVLKHDKEVSKAIKKFKYQEEIKFLVTNTKRNNFIKNLTLSLNENSIILFNYVEHGKILFELLQNSKHLNGRNVYLIYGGVEGEERERIRQIVETESNAIILGSISIMGTGINIKSLHNIIFAINGKSSIRLLQSIGRSLRLHESKEKAKIFDIIDDLSVGKHQNFTLKHFFERVKVYNDQQFDYKLKTIEFR